MGGYAYESKGPLFGLIANTGGSIFSTKNNSVTIPILNPCTVHGAGILLANNLAANNMTVRVLRRLVPNNTTNNSVVANFTVGPYANTSPGQIWYAGNNFAPVDLDAGDELMFTAGDGGGACTWHPWLDAVPRAETKVNNNDFKAATNTA